MHGQVPVAGGRIAAISGWTQKLGRRACRCRAALGLPAGDVREAAGQDVISSIYMQLGDNSSDSQTVDKIQKKKLFEIVSDKHSLLLVC